MSEAIVTAIDGELAQLEQRAAALRGLRALTLGIESGQLEEIAERLARLTGEAHTLAPLRIAPVPGEVEDPQDGPEPLTPPSPEPSTPSDAERAKRQEAAQSTSERIVNLARRRGDITVHDVIAAGLAESAPHARKLILRLCNQNVQRLRATGDERQGPRGGRPAKVYEPAEAEATTADESGAKTGPERRVVEAVRELQPVDSGTLAFRSHCSVNDLSSIAAGLVRRGVLERADEDGVVLFRLGAEAVAA